MFSNVQAGRVRQVVSTRMPTKWGLFQMLGFEREILNGTRRIETALALVLGDVTEDAPLLRIHSQCLTGEAFGSLRCDCNKQLEVAMRAIAEEGRGLVIYEYQEGRGIGLMAKLRAYAFQDEGLDTVEANHALGFAADCRDFRLSAGIVHELGVRRVRLLTNNLQKVRALTNAGIEVIARIPCEVAPNPHSIAYLRAKKEKMGHVLVLGPRSYWQDNDRTRNRFDFASIEDAIKELRAGRMIVVVDDKERENEGDLMMAADAITPEAINFMATHGRGLICLALTGQRIDELRLDPMLPKNDALGGTAFTVSIDVKNCGVTTGISAHDRAQTIRAAIDSSSDHDDFAMPGHVFPLRARAGGVLERRGHTEAAVDLASLAGSCAAGVICEIVNDDGTMARVPDLVRFCQRHNLLMITVADLARYRLESKFTAKQCAMDDVVPISFADSATTELGHAPAVAATACMASAGQLR
jgi:3,4-dihydroxy-2-butanone 4-phosphate synthase/GTP cyclohydrolase II